MGLFATNDFLGGEVRRVEETLLEFAPSRSFTDFTVTLPAVANTPFELQHTLPTNDPNKVRWEVIQSPFPVLVYRDNDDAQGANVLTLRATLASGIIRLRLTVDDGEAIEFTPASDGSGQVSIPGFGGNISIGHGTAPVGNIGSILQFNAPGATGSTLRSLGFAEITAGAGSELSFIDFNRADDGRMMRWRRLAGDIYEFGPHATGATFARAAGGFVNLGSAFDSAGAGYWDTLYVNNVKFPATQVASADANTLDDYEEVDFTPTLVSTGGGTPTYAAQVGSATKIGRKVKAQIYVQLATLGTLAAGNLSIAGLPYTSRNLTNLFALAAIQWSGLATNWVNMNTLILPNTTSLLIRGAAAAGVNNATNVTVADLTGTSSFVITIEYDATA